MSVNDTPTDNPQVPVDAKVVPLDWVKATRERLAAEESAKTDSSRLPEEDDGIPAEQTFEVALRSIDSDAPSVVLTYKGYMIATSVFVGFADEDGIVHGVVPMDRVLYVRAVEVAAA
jgi:hypothetical protein